MKEMTVAEFCDEHDACEDGREWAIATGQTMSEIWARDDLGYQWRMWIATREGVLDDKTLRLFACWCVRQVWHLLTDERIRNAVEVSERYANSEATDNELDAARDAARAAAWAAARAAAWAAARAAARDAARAAAWAAARAAAWAAARDAQSKWLRENAQPNFEGGNQ